MNRGFPFLLNIGFGHLPVSTQSVFSMLALDVIMENVHINEMISLRKPPRYYIYCIEGICGVR